MIQWSNSSDNESGAPFRLTLYIVRILLAVVQFIHFLRNHRTKKYSYFRVHSNSFFLLFFKCNELIRMRKLCFPTPTPCRMYCLCSQLISRCSLGLTLFAITLSPPRHSIEFIIIGTHFPHILSPCAAYSNDGFVTEASLKRRKIPKECQSLFNARCVVGVSWIKINYYYSQKSFQFSIIYLILWRFFLRLYLFFSFRDI